MACLAWCWQGFRSLLSDGEYAAITGEAGEWGVLDEDLIADAAFGYDPLVLADF